MSVKIDGLTGASRVLNSEVVPFDNVASQLSAINVQEALDEIESLKLDTANAFGVGQTWQNVSASRALGVTYTNTTGKPLYVHLFATYAAATSTNLSVGGSLIPLTSNNQTNGEGLGVGFIVPLGETYSIVGGIGVTTVIWYELR